MATWQIGDAKAKLCAIIERAQHDGAQTIIADGLEQAVVVSIDHYQVLSKRKPDFTEHLLGGPNTDGDFDIRVTTIAGGLSIFEAH